MRSLSALIVAFAAVAGSALAAPSYDAAAVAKIHGGIVDCVGCNLKGADLTRADAQGANFRDADLSRAKLARANLRRANLHDVRLEGVEFENTTMPDGTTLP